jgi:hypothetical protein
MHHISADLAARAVDPLLDLVTERIDQRRPLQPDGELTTRLTTLHVVLDGLVVAASQLGRRGRCPLFRV